MRPREKGKGQERVQPNVVPFDRADWKVFSNVDRNDSSLKHGHRSPTTTVKLVIPNLPEHSTPWDFRRAKFAAENSSISPRNIAARLEKGGAVRRHGA